MRFGSSMATGDYDADGFTDLAVGAPDSTIAQKRAAGGVAVIYGSRTGLNLARRQFLTQDTDGVPGSAEREDTFGSTLDRRRLRPRQGR